MPEVLCFKSVEKFFIATFEKKHWHCNYLLVHFPLNNWNYLEMLSSSSCGESEESCSVPVTSTAKALIAGDTASNLTSLRTSKTQARNVSSLPEPLISTLTSVSGKCRAVHSGLLYKRLNRTIPLLFHPFDASQANKMTTCNWQIRQVSSNTFIVLSHVATLCFFAQRVVFAGCSPCIRWRWGKW